ncbi:MAG: hypothetical protein H8D92_01375 [Pelagibacteraceae bacterium]|nr:hypothetical protein [Pelagibacteraceae bacterium]
MTSNNVERTSNAVRCLLSGIDINEISVKNGHDMIDNLLSRDMSTPTHESIFKTSEPKLDVIVLPPTDNFDSYAISIFVNKPMASHLKMAKELCEKYRYNNDFGVINTMFIENIEGRWRRDNGLEDRLLINAYQSRTVNDMKAKVGVLKNPSLITNGFYYTVVEYPHTREMVSYYVKDTIKFADELVITNNHYLQQNMNVSLQCMFDNAEENEEGEIIV